MYIYSHFLWRKSNMLQITQLDSVPSIGSLLGSRGTRELMNTVGKSLGSSAFFGSSNDRFSKIHNTFIRNYVEPIRRAHAQMVSLSSKLIDQDYIRILNTEKDLETCPPCMMIPILTYEPVWTLLRQGRICGYGYTSDELVDEKEVYDRLIDTNGVVDWSEGPNSDGEYWAYETIDWLKDPELTFEERIMIQETREYIEKFLKDTDLDPTCPTELRG